MLFFGTFGTDASEASQRADRRMRSAVIVYLLLAVATAMAPGIDVQIRRGIHTALIGLLLAVIGWQRWSYANGLDELGRRIYVDSLAITYLIGLTLFFIGALAQSVTGWTVNPLIFVALEPLRAGIMVWRSRPFRT